ncbi:MAG: hemerythrin domain-containing protein [Nitrospira sp.]|nr:hemerythrin domain-containing protein [Nitrospira sp.]
MGEATIRTSGPLGCYLTEDHRRLERLLQATATDSDKLDDSSYALFRAGLLRHIGMEEKILLTAVHRLRGGEPLPVAAKLRLDHGALAALLMPTPTGAIIATIRAILADHDQLEEGPGGVYEICDELAVSEAEQLLAKLRAAPEVSVMPHSDGPAVMHAVHRALERAGYRLRAGIEQQPRE